MNLITVREARELKHPRMTQERLSELSGVDQTTISSLETGRHTNPTRNTIERLAKALGVAPSELRFTPPQPSRTVDRSADSAGHASAKAS